MRGRVLNFDFRTGGGIISGDDGQRYRFEGKDWKPTSQPKAGQYVDYDARDQNAFEIYAIAGENPLAGDSNRFVAALLALFLGGLGIHKFYLKKNGAGLTMLLCSLFGIIFLFIPTIIVGLIAFGEAIKYFLISDQEFENTYVLGDRAWF